MFLKLTELRMLPGKRECADGESQYADRDTYTPSASSIWVNMAHIASMRVDDVSVYANKPERFPQGRPQTTTLYSSVPGDSFTVTETPEEIGRLLQKAPSDAD